jgi:hypothetical protein
VTVRLGLAAFAWHPDDILRRPGTSVAGIREHICFR